MGLKMRARGGRPRWLVPAVVGCLLSASLWPQPAFCAPSDLLRKALNGPKRAYEGVQETRLFSETGSTVSRVLIRADGYGRARREFVSGPAAGVVVIQRGSQTWQKAPNGEFGLLPSAGSADPASTTSLIVQNYKVSVSAGPSVAGRITDRLAISAKRDFNPSRALCVDRSTGLILRDEWFAPGGNKRSRTEFIEVRYTAQAASHFTVPEGSRSNDVSFGPGSFVARGSAAAVRTETGRATPLPGHIPAGYVVSTYGVMTTGGGFKTPAVRYSDGLAAFTVFVRGASPAGGGGPPWRRGGQGPRRYRRGGAPRSDTPGNIQTESDRQRAVVTYVSRTASYILIGDIAGDELARVAKSLP